MVKKTKKSRKLVVQDMTVDNMTESMKKEQAAGWDYSVLINNPILPSVFKIVK